MQALKVIGYITILILYAVCMVGFLDKALQ